MTTKKQPEFNDLDPSLIEVREAPVEDLLKEFKYRVKPTPTHERILELASLYYKNNEKFMLKKNRAAAKRARQALLELAKLTIPRRAEIQKTVNNFEKGEFL